MHSINTGFSKRKGILNIYTSISFNSDMNEINVYTDGGRCCRPLYITDNRHQISKKQLVQAPESYNWFNLIIGGKLNGIN